MREFETIIVEGGIAVLALLTVLRFVVYEVRNLKREITGKRR